MTSRRQFLRTAASASIATAAAGGALAVHVTDAAASDSVAAKMDALLVEYLAETREEKRLCRLYGNAADSLPAWARPGPSMLMPDGTKGGPDSGWPEAAELPDPSMLPSDGILIRQGPREYWRSRRQSLYEPCKAVRHPDGSVFLPSVPLTGEARRAAYRESVAGVRTIVSRRREQKALEVAAGMPQIEAAIDASSDRRDEMRDRMAAAAIDASPAAIATLALLEAHFDAATFPMAVLRLMEPHLSGLLRIVVADMLANAEDDGNGTIFATGMIEGRASA